MTSTPAIASGIAHPRYSVLGEVLGSVCDSSRGEMCGVGVIGVIGVIAAFESHVRVLRR